MDRKGVWLRGRKTFALGVFHDNEVEHVNFVEESCQVVGKEYDIYFVPSITKETFNNIWTYSEIPSKPGLVLHSRIKMIPIRDDINTDPIQQTFVVSFEQTL